MRQDIKSFLLLQSSCMLGTGLTTPTSEAGSLQRPGSASGESGRSSRGSARARIPRPISLPKRLEDKLSIRASRPASQPAPGGRDNILLNTGNRFCVLSRIKLNY